MAKTEMKGWLKVLYTIFLALLIAFFYGLGVSAFYPSPKSPDYPVSLENAKTEPVNFTEDQKKDERELESAMKKYEEEMKVYNRNASMMNLTLAVISLVISFLFIHKIFLISDSLLLGGIFTLAYSIILGLTTEDARYRFIVVTIGLVVTLVVGYFKYIKPRVEK